MVAPLIAPRRTSPVRRRLSPRRELRRRRRQALIALLVVGGLLAVGIIGALLATVMVLVGPLSGESTPSSSDACEPETNNDPGVRSAVDSTGLDRDQLANAQTIIAVGKRLKVSEYGWVIAVATAMQESSLRNLDYGDRPEWGSLGLFQQRPAWGSVAARMNPETSSTMFYTGGKAGQPGLLDIEGWEQMPVTVAAQAVQRSAFPDAYADDEPLARELVARYGGVEVGGDCGEGEPLMACPKSPFTTAEEGLTPYAKLVLRCTHQRWPQFHSFSGVDERPKGGDGDHINGRAVDMMIPYRDYKSAEAREFGWKVANWLRSNRQRLGIKYIIYDNKIWSVLHNSEGWRPYQHYKNDCTTDTCLHYDHIHVSVYDWTLPVKEGSYRLSARFGACGGNWSNCHTGLDFAAPTGTPVLAASGGKVVQARRSRGPYGNYIVIDHGQGIQTMYAHLSAFAPKVKGAQVAPGMMIGEVGSTGNSTGPHLHFEVREQGNPIDPEAWLQDHGVRP
ncbi:MAG TPA: M23 family metallopeptidase [Actinopolymorphaceae bacterium]